MRLKNRAQLHYLRLRIPVRHEQANEIKQPSKSARKENHESQSQSASQAKSNKPSKKSNPTGLGGQKQPFRGSGIPLRLRKSSNFSTKKVVTCNFGVKICNL